MSDGFTADKLAWLRQVQDDDKISAAAFSLAYVISRHLNSEKGYAWAHSKHAGQTAERH